MGTAITLILIAVILIFLNLRALLKDKRSFQGILKSSENNMDEFQVEIGKLRREFAETLLEIQTQLVELEEKVQSNNDYIKDQNKKCINNENDINNLEKCKDIASFNDKIRDIVDIDFNRIKSLDNEVKLQVENNEPLTAKENYGTNVEQEDNNDNAENNSIKIKEVEKLLNEGLNIDEISDALKIGKGEVLLIKELYLK